MFPNTWCDGRRAGRQALGGVHRRAGDGGRDAEREEARRRDAVGVEQAVDELREKPARTYQPKSSVTGA